MAQRQTAQAQRMIQPPKIPKTGRPRPADPDDCDVRELT